MKNEVKVAFYLKRNEEKDDGTCPVMARLTVGATEAVFSAKLTVPAGMWASGRAKGKSQTTGEINRRLDEIRASALAHWRDLMAIREKVYLSIIWKKKWMSSRKWLLFQIKG